MGKVDPKLLEMADVFHIPKAARMKYIILPAKLPGLSKMLRGSGRGKAQETFGKKEETEGRNEGGAAG